MAELVAIGDSLVQGAGSMAVGDGRRSFPAIVAGCMGITDEKFRCPDFSGSGGLPFNFEWMARNLERIAGKRIRGPEWISAAVHVGKMLDDVEDYWERGAGIRQWPDVRYHNLGVFGYQVCDAHATTCSNALKRIGVSRDNVLQPPSYSWLRIAAKLFNPAMLSERMDDSQLKVMERIHQTEGGIRNLIVCIGANNCLNTVLRLDILETGDTSPGSDSGYTLWRAAAFREEYEALASQAAACAPEHVFVATVPHVTTMPIVRGIMADGGVRPAGRDFWDYYVPVWMSESSFSHKRDHFITGLEAQGIDERVDEYNAIIREIADRHGWHVVDLCRLTDDCNWDRHRGRPIHTLPAPIRDLDSRFLKLDNWGNRTEGGLVSLDGMHPTLCGYGLFAQAFVDAIRATGQAIDDVDFAAIRAADTLVSHPPATIGDSFAMLSLLERHFHMSRWLVLDHDRGFVLRR